MRWDRCDSIIFLYVIYYAFVYVFIIINVVASSSLVQESAAKCLDFERHEWSSIKLKK